MSNKKKMSSEEFLTYAVGALLGGILIATGIWLTYKFKGESDIFYSKIVPFFVSELGIAVIIALIIIFTVERFSRNRHEEAAFELIKGINKNLFRAVYDRYIPDSVFKEVESCLLKAKVVRTKYEIDYDLSYISEADLLEHQIPREVFQDYLCCNINTSYSVTNITDSSIKQDIVLKIEQPVDETTHNLIHISKVKIGGTLYSKEYIDVNVTENSNSVHKVFKINIVIPANTTVPVEMTAETLKRKLDQEVWSSRLPSDGLKLSVHSPKSFKVLATANHSQALTENIINNGRTTVWRLDAGIFPHQSIIFWWDAGGQ